MQMNEAFIPVIPANRGWLWQAYSQRFPLSERGKLSLY